MLSISFHLSSLCSQSLEFSCGLKSPTFDAIPENNKTFSFLTGSLPLLIILAGVIGGIVIIVACTMVAILCKKRSKKAQGK